MAENGVGESEGFFVQPAAARYVSAAVLNGATFALLARAQVEHFIATNALSYW